MTWRIIYFRVNKYRKSYTGSSENWLETTQITLRKIQPMEKPQQTDTCCLISHMDFSVMEVTWGNYWTWVVSFLTETYKKYNFLLALIIIFLLKPTKSTISLLFLKKTFFFFWSKNIFKLTNSSFIVYSAIVCSLTESVTILMWFPCLTDDEWILMTMK